MGGAAAAASNAASVRRRSPWRRLLELGVTALVTVFILRRVGVDLTTLGRLDLSAWEPSPLPLLGSVLVLASGYLVSASLWGRLVRELGGPRLELGTSVPLFMVANLGRYVPGKVIQIAGLTWLARRRGVPAPVAAGAAILGQGVALLGATILGLAAFFSPALDPAYRLWGWSGLVGATTFVVLTSLPGPAARLERGWFRLAGGTPPPSETDPVSRAGFGLRWTTLYVLNWSLYAVAFWLLYLGLAGWAPFLYVGPAFAAAYVGGYLALFAPAGLGVREGLLAAFLAPVLEPEGALALAVVARIWATAVEVIPAGLMTPGVLRSARTDAGGA
ncbi:MAG: lysylphosphatidylglycerol synthase domain-containing protein, partial [Gemmatimonadota bacterium]